MITRKKAATKRRMNASFQSKRSPSARLRLKRGFTKNGVRNLEILELPEPTRLLGKRAQLQPKMAENSSSKRALSPKSRFELKMNRVMTYPRGDEAPDHLVSLRELVSLEENLPESLLATTFGHEKEFIDFLLEKSKVSWPAPFGNLTEGADCFGQWNGQRGADIRR